MATGWPDWETKVKAITDTVTISGTATVTITGTPAVTISGTPTVDINTGTVSLTTGTITYKDQFDEVIEAKRGTNIRTNINIFSSASEEAQAGSGSWDDVANSEYTVTAQDVADFNPYSDLAGFGVFYGYTGKSTFTPNSLVRLVVDGDVKDTDVTLGLSYDVRELSWIGPLVEGSVIKLQQRYDNASHTITIKDRLIHDGLNFNKNMTSLSNYFTRKIIIAANTTIIINEVTSYTYSSETTIEFNEPIAVTKLTYETDDIVYLLHQKT